MSELSKASQGDFDMNRALTDWSAADREAFKEARLAIREAGKLLDRKPLDPATVGSVAHLLEQHGRALRQIGEARHLSALRAKEAAEANPFVAVNRVGEELLARAVKRARS